MPSASLEFLDPRHFPVSYDAKTDAFLFTRMDEATLLAPFLDSRLGAAWDRRMPFPAARIRTPKTPHPPTWLFHTAFCCSTLLARALHDPPATVSLKEPHVLLDLANLSLARSHAPELLRARIDTTVSLLGRPWTEGGRILLKPTNVANRLLQALLDAAPGSRAVLLHGSLEEFLVSCIKKLPGAEQPLRWMVQYLLPGTRLERVLGIASGQPFNPVESAVLIWHAQMELYADALAADVGDRLRTLSMDTLLARPDTAVAACAEWLGLPSHPSDDPLVRHERIAAVFSRNSKTADARYGPEKRERERQQLRTLHGPLVDAALEWAAREVTPQAVLPARGGWKPLAVAAESGGATPRPGART